MPPKNHGGRAHHGKHFREVQRRFEKHELHSPREAVELVQSMAREAGRKFDETIELSFNLGLDVRKADQQLRGTVSLPGGTGKDVRVAVFAAGDLAREAQEAGADFVGTDDLVARVEGGFLDFDVAIAAPDQMAQVGKLGRTLGPRGLMPNPKTGTVTTDIGKAVAEFKGGMVEYRTDRAANVAVPIGKVSFEARGLHANYLALVEEVQRAKPAAAKGRYIKSLTVSSTMGPGVRVDPARATEAFDEEATAPSAAS
jgi:large subunit ribosomal protein L1